MIIDNIAVSYNSLEELLSRQQYIENKVTTYLQTNPIADMIESTIRITNNKYILNIALIKEEYGINA